jgi:serralysin
MAYLDANGVLLPISRLASSWIGGGGALYGNSGDNGFYGSGDDTLTGGLGDDTYMVWVPSTTVVEAAGGGVDTLDSRVWGEAILPENVENLLLNGPGTTAGTGNGLRNVIIAGSVGATLDGQGGDDVLVSGAGADLLRIQAGNGSDAIEGFVPGSDLIRLVGYGISTFSQLAQIATQQADDLAFTFSNGEKLVLRDVTLSQLDAYDFGLDQPLPALPPGHQELVGPGQVYSAFGWYVLNNVWNPGPLVYGTDYTIDTSYDPTDLTEGVTFTWAFPFTTKAFPTIIAYPEVIFGPAPMSGGHKPTDIGGVFPLQVSEIVDLTADYAVAIEGNTDGFNVAFDIWLTDVPNGGPGSVTNEVMVWVHKGGVTPYGDLAGTYTDGSISAKIYVSHSGDWTYTAVVLDEDRLVGEISVSGVLARLQALGVVSSSEYLASLELGSEIVSGAGSLTIDDLTLNATLDDRTIEVTGSGTTVHTFPDTPDLSGDDRVVYDPTRSLIEGGEGSDTLVLNTGATVRLDRVSTSQVDGPAYVTGFENVDASAANTGVTLYGSSYANVLVGGAYTDTLSGGDGADILTGGGGGDVIDGGAGADRIQGGDGNDRITYAAADQSIDAGAGSDTLVLTVGATVRLDRVSTSQVDGGAYVSGFEKVDASGASVAVNLTGSAYANTLTGGTKRDVLTGGGGADQFVFKTAPKATTADTITDFEVGLDKIHLDASFFTGLPTGALASGALAFGTTASASDDRIMYDQTSGSLYFDRDGSASGHAALMFATIDPGQAVTAQDFWVIA